MRLRDWKGVRVGERKAGLFHLTFLPASSANSPATTPVSPELLWGGLREARPDARCHSGLAEGEEKVRVLDSCWQRPGRSLGPFFPTLHPSWGSGHWFVGWGEPGQSPHRHPAGSCGLPVASCLGGEGGSMDGESEGGRRGTGGEQEGSGGLVACSGQGPSWERDKEWEFAEEHGGKRS